MDSKPSSSKSKIDDSNLVSIPASLSRDPLGLNDLQATYSYSLDESGIHNFIIPISSSSSNNFVVSGQNFNIAPSVGLDKEKKSYRLVSTTEKSSVKIPTKLSAIDKKAYEENVEYSCEWDDCGLTFQKENTFLQHVSEHVHDIPIISTKITAKSIKEDGMTNLEESGQKTYGCLWQDCGFETPHNEDMVRHLNFHSFHTKIKSVGAVILRETKGPSCQLSSDERNILPQLPACDFECQWENCQKREETFSEPVKFYWHVQWHAEEYRVNKKFAFGYHKKSETETDPDAPPPVKKPKQEILCKWRGCNYKAPIPFKLRDHLRSHSAERIVACPNCGGLFGSKTKFFDHCQRQVKVTKETGLKCSYCQKYFPSDRLLRDHMRSHINNFQCPICEMTCTSATNLNKHITYRHTDEKTFDCPFKDEDIGGCDFQAKFLSDINKHVDSVHYIQNVFKCEECKHTCRSKTALKFHVEKAHKNEGPKYCCHLCKKRFRRGNYLTGHLSSVHDYKWRPGHAKFLYTKDENGLYHVQTMRFERIDLMSTNFEQEEEN